MEMPDHVVVLITAGTAGEAQQIAALLLERRRAACVNRRRHGSDVFRYRPDGAAAPHNPAEGTSNSHAGQGRFSPSVDCRPFARVGGTSRIL